MTRNVSAPRSEVLREIKEGVAAALLTLTERACTASRDGEVTTLQALWRTIMAELCAVQPHDEVGFARDLAGTGSAITPAGS